MRLKLPDRGSKGDLDKADLGKQSPGGSRLAVGPRPERLSGASDPSARLFVDAKQSGEVWIDRVDSGWATPTNAILLPAGPHTVAVRGRASSGQMTVTLAPGETRRVVVETGGSPD